MKSLLLTISLITFSTIYLFAQTVPVGMPVLDESLRTLQLEGRLDLKYSLSSRPFFTDKSVTTDSLYRFINPNSKLTAVRKEYFNHHAAFELLPVTFSSEYNSHHPYGWNHAGMIDAKAVQGFISTGVYAA